MFHIIWASSYLDCVASSLVSALEEADHSLVSAESQAGNNTSPQRACHAYSRPALPRLNNNASSLTVMVPSEVLEAWCANIVRALRTYDSLAQSEPVLVKVKVRRRQTIRQRHARTAFQVYWPS